MAKPDAGIYTIIPVAATSKALDVSGGSLSDGANVQIYTINATDAQTFQLTYREDGTAQIASRLTGKCVDVEGDSAQSGTNIQMYTDNDTRAQSWDITEKSTVTIGGTSYKTYELAVHGLSLCMDVYGGGSSAGTNVWAYTRNNTNAQRWAFVPIAPFKSGGIYEIRSMLDTGKCADVASASKANGANVQLYVCNHTNAQKWTFTQESDGWSIRNIASGKYMDVDGASFADGTNVQSYQDNDTRAQRWSITALGTTTLEGQTCQVVSIGADNDTDYMLDDLGANTSSGNNIQIYQANGTSAQRWALWPTWAEDEFMPSPYNLGITENEASVAWASSMSLTVHPTWECAPAYATSGPNAYQIRHRTRKMSSTTSTWGSWTDWTSWETANVTKDAQKSVLTQGIALSMTNSHKAMQLEYQVRATGVDELALLYGAAASHTVTLCPKPTVDFSTATMTAGGMSVGYSSNYGAGSTTVYLEGIVLSGHNILKRPLTITALDSTDSVDIPMQMLSDIPASGSSVTLRYGLGTDMMPRFNGILTDTVSVSYGSGSATVTPTFALDGYALTATFPDESDTKVWVSAGNGVVECEKVSTSNGVSTFDVPFPMGTEYRIFATGHSGNNWFVWTGTRTENVTPAHVWDFGGGRAVLKLRQGTPPTTNDTIDAESETWMLNARGYETVGFTGTRKHRFTAVGAVTGTTDSSRSDFELLAGTHAVYRSPAGDIVNVAVLGVDREAHREWTEISVSMARESE